MEVNGAHLFRSQKFSKHLVCSGEEGGSYRFGTSEDDRIVILKWSSPSEVLHSYKSKEIWIAPPQFYELGRMRQFPALTDLHGFAWQRSLDGCEHWLPVLLLAPDCVASILPGDALYPEKVDPSGRSGGVMKTEKSLEELQRDSTNLHRIVGQDPYSLTVHMNITPKYNHLSPLCAADVDNSSKDHSKL